jgi:hypothetical protein
VSNGSSKNDITMDTLRTRGPSKEYDEGYARIFGTKIPQAECAPREAQPVGPRTTLNYDGTFDTTCAHCGGNGCFACLKSAAPTPERADAGKDKVRGRTPVDYDILGNPIYRDIDLAIDNLPVPLLK